MFASFPETLLLPFDSQTRRSSSSSSDSGSRSASHDLKKMEEALASASFPFPPPTLAPITPITPPVPLTHPIATSATPSFPPPPPPPPGLSSAFSHFATATFSTAPQSRSDQEPHHRPISPSLYRCPSESQGPSRSILENLQQAQLARQMAPTYPGIPLQPLSSESAAQYEVWAVKNAAEVRAKLGLSQNSETRPVPISQHSTKTFGGPSEESHSFMTSSSSTIADSFRSSFAPSGSGSVSNSLSSAEMAELVGRFSLSFPFAARSLLGLSSPLNESELQRLFIGDSCSHYRFWERVRSKKGYNHFKCELCGAKWRIMTNKRRAQEHLY